MTGAVVAVGGDIRVFGTRPDGTGWRIGVRDPSGDPAPLARLMMTSGAVSTSGDYERFFVVDGVRYHHILDPRTLRPARRVHAVTVTAPDGATADALATGLFVMGRKRGRAVVADLPGVAALWVDGDGAVTVSDHWPGDVPMGG